MIPTINDIIEGPVFKGDSILGSLLRDADLNKAGIFYSVWIMKRKMEYISPLCTELIGYTQHDFVSGSADFVFSIIHEDALPDVVKKQIEFVKLCKDPLFDPYSETLQEFRTPFKSKEGTVLPFVSYVTPLLFNEKADVEYSLGMICRPDKKSQTKCKKLLQAIKKRHNEIYTHPKFSLTNEPLNLVHLTSERLDKKISTREAEVLSYLGKGLSTEEISLAMGISLHTVITYRKNLLQKLDAKNSAELIKKASKIFWLE